MVYNWEHAMKTPATTYRDNHHYDSAEHQKQIEELKQSNQDPQT